MTPKDTGKKMSNAGGWLGRIAIVMAALVAWPAWTDDSGAPPVSYSLTDVVVEYSVGGGFGPAHDTRLRIGGSGDGVREIRGGPAKVRIDRFKVAPEKVVELLDLCYRQYFFDLRSTYSGETRVRLDEQGRVQLLEPALVADAPSQSITVRIGSYVKSVTYQQSPPQVVGELARLINRLFEEGMK